MSSIRTQARGELSRLNVIRLLAFGMLLIFTATARAQQNPPITEQIAETYGLRSFGQSEALRYTWNVESPNGTVSRSWEWTPKTDTVSYEGKDKEGKPVKASYQRPKLSSQSDAIKNEIDPAFANDQYWLQTSWCRRRAQRSRSFSCNALIVFASRNPRLVWGLQIIHL
jgi:hypothetical protein